LTPKTKAAQTVKKKLTNQSKRMNTMTDDNTYNGWTNYATWRVNLEMIDGIDPSDMGWKLHGPCELADFIKDYVDEILEIDAKEGLALDYARAFISDVNWREIARAMIETYGEDEDEDEDEEVAA
jgi:hypothetical protein